MKFSPNELAAWLIIIVIFTLSPVSAQQAQESQPQTKPTITEKEPITVKGGTVKISKAPKTQQNPAQEIDRVQEELQQVLMANQRLQQDYVRRMEKIQQITAQAKIHQKILNQIKTNTSQQSSAVQQAVQQEKIRLIAEQARKNQEMLKALRQSKQQSPS